jgi:3-phosphoshikimate 1-carboxyvinyltransferase
LITVANVPGSKSITQRALLLAARSDIPCTIRGGLKSEDTDAMLNGLFNMGYGIMDDGETVQTRPAQAAEPEATIDCANSGTTLRFLMAQAALSPWTIRFDGDASLRARTVGPLAEALRSGGAKVDGTKAPVRVTGSFAPGQYVVDGSASSQFTSSLLLALPFLPDSSTLQVTGNAVSRPYVDLTMRIMSEFGLGVAKETEPGGEALFVVDGDQTCRASSIVVAPDWSTAAFYLVAGGITGGAYIPGLVTGTGQPDEAILHILSSFGLQVERAGHGVTVYPGPRTSPGKIELRDTPDLLPALAILAACSDGTTTFVGAAHARGKESDRIRAMVEGLARMGINAHPRPDGLSVSGGALHGAPIHAYGDHRVHMAFEVAGLAADGPVQVDGRHSVNVSHPGFHERLRRFRAA